MQMSKMQAHSLDTDPESERVQTNLLRQASPARRAQMALALSAQVIDLARLHILRSTGTTDHQSIGLRVVERLYGHALARDLERHLARQK